MRIRPRLRTLRNLQLRDLGRFLKSVYLDIPAYIEYILAKRMTGGWVVHAEAVAAISQHHRAHAGFCDSHEARCGRVVLVDDDAAVFGELLLQRVVLGELVAPEGELVLLSIGRSGKRWGIRT